MRCPIPAPSTITNTTALLCPLVRLERLTDNRLLGHFALHKMREIFKHSRRTCIFHSTSFCRLRMLVSNRTTRQPIATALLHYKSCWIFHKSRPNEMYFFTRQCLRPLVRLDNRLLGPFCLQTRTDIM